MLGAEFPVNIITRVGISGKKELIISKQILHINIKENVLIINEYIGGDVHIIIISKPKRICYRNHKIDSMNEIFMKYFVVKRSYKYAYLPRHKEGKMLLYYDNKSKYVICKHRSSDFDYV